MRNIVFEPDAWDDIGWWAKQDPKMLSRIYDIIINAAKQPFEGIGKPEPLKGNYKGYWSRRINQEHRLVYKVDDESIIIILAKGHYQ